APTVNNTKPIGIPVNRRAIRITAKASAVIPTPHLMFLMRNGVWNLLFFQDEIDRFKQQAKRQQREPNKNNEIRRRERVMQQALTADVSLEKCHCFLIIRRRQSTD